MDIKIKGDGWQYRNVVRAIIKQDEKYLVMRIVEPDGTKTCFQFVGGTVEFQEDAETAIRREIKEELGCDIASAKMLAIADRVWQDKKRGRLHEPTYLFSVTLSCDLSMDDYTKTEIDKGIKQVLEFKWLTRNQLKTLDVQPKVFNDLILNGDVSKFCYLLARD